MFRLILFLLAFLAPIGNLHTRVVFPCCPKTNPKSQKHWKSISNTNALTHSQPQTRGIMIRLTKVCKITYISTAIPKMQSYRRDTDWVFRYKYWFASLVRELSFKVVCLGNQTCDFFIWKFSFAIIRFWSFARIFHLGFFIRDLSFCHIHLGL